MTATETTETGPTADTVTLVMRGLLHELANVATALDGVQSALRFDGAPAVERAAVELGQATDRVFALHTSMRSLLPDREGASALDPRALAAEAGALLAWHVERPATISLDEGPAAPILGEAWRVRRQLLEALDAALGEGTALRFSFRVDGETISAVTADGRALWSSPTLAAARRLERGAAG